MLALLLALPLSAQEGHLKFKDIPLYGNYQLFAQKLIQKGFRKSSDRDGVATLAGPFMGFPKVTVKVNSDPSTLKVTSVVAMLEAEENWEELEALYRETVEVYTQKYGQPRDHAEAFSVEARGGAAKLEALRSGQCLYRSHWKFGLGDIFIVPLFSGGKYYITCTYNDNKEKSLYPQSVFDDI